MGLLPDIYKPIYNRENRKMYEYDDDIAVLFYKGYKVFRGEFEKFNKTRLIEESFYYRNVAELIEKLNPNFICNTYFEVEDKDLTWPFIWERMEWHEYNYSFHYGNWELVVLDI